MQNLNWVPHVLSLELKKALSYRVDFWVQFVIGTATDMAIAYFLWLAMFSTNHTQVMQGYSFYGIVYYYLFATFSMRIARGAERGYISQEIYEGGLTKYLLYPLPFVGYKFVTHFSQQLLAIFQLLLALGLMVALIGLPADQNISVLNFLAGIGTCLLAGYLHFVLASCLEMVAFWQDVVWNLMVMLRFIVVLLGGGMIPLSFFPEWGRKLAESTPFVVLVHFPTETFLGKMGLDEWLRNFVVLTVWAVFFTWFLGVVWRRGLKQYSGVGI